MARTPRIHVPGGLYHVTLRGNHRQAIFRVAYDYVLLNELVVEVLDQLDASLCAYCWMPNHLHFAIRVASEPLGSVMRRIASRYARLFQARLETTGHLFERRYYARLVDDESYALAVLRYVHLNPVAADIVRDPAAYPWSSHREYLGLRQTAWVTVGPLLAMFDEDVARARAAYRSFVLAGLSDTSGFELPKHSVEPTTFDASRQTTCPGRVPKWSGGWEELVRVCCQALGVDAREVMSGCRARRVVHARLRITHMATSRGVMSLQATAQQFGLHESSLRKALERFRRRQGGIKALQMFAAEIEAMAAADRRPNDELRLKNVENR